MFQRLMNTIARFMAGRYGTDQLNRFLFVTYFVLWLVAQFIRNDWAGMFFALLLWGILLWLLFRTLSRNIPRRQVENERFLRWWTPVKGWFSRLWTRLRDVRRYRYRTCPACGAHLRLPVKRGRRTVTCHRCHNQFKAFFL